MLRALALLALVLLPSVASAQRNIPPGKEAIILEAVREAFADSPAAGVQVDRDTLRVDTGEGAILVAALDPELRVTLTCAPSPCDAHARDRWAPVAARLEASLTPRVDAIWAGSLFRVQQPGPERSTPLAIRQALSWGLFLVVLLALFVAPAARIPGSRRIRALALVLVAGFAAAGLAVSPPRPLHDHLCFIERMACAASLACDVSHAAWGRPTFHLMGVLLQLVPHRAAWIYGLGVVLSALVLALTYDVTARVARRAGLEARAGEAGLFAVLALALHPGVLRLAGAGSFWPLSLALLLAALQLFLRAMEGEGWRRSVALAGAGAAFALALGGNRLMLLLVPLLALVPYAWRSARLRGWDALAALPALAIAGFAVADVFSQNRYGAVDRAGDPLALLLAALSLPANSATTWAFTSPLVLPAALLALASRRRLRPLLPLAYTFFALTIAAISVTGKVSWEAYPDVYLKHFASLVSVAPLFGIGAAVAAAFLVARLPFQFGGRRTGLAASAPPPACERGSGGGCDEDGRIETPPPQPSPASGGGSPSVVSEQQLERGLPLPPAGGGRGEGAAPTGRIESPPPQPSPASGGGSPSARGLSWLIAPLFALALAITAWTRPDAVRLLFASRVMERELFALERAFEELPPHATMAVAGILPPPEGIARAGDPLEMHFPAILYRAALERRGIRPGRIIDLADMIESGRVDRPTLVYVGSTLRSFYPGEIEAGRVPDSLERPELARLREHFVLEPVHLFTVSTDQPSALRERVAADRQPSIELGFYWVRPRESR